MPGWSIKNACTPDLHRYMPKYYRGIDIFVNLVTCEPYRVAFTGAVLTLIPHPAIAGSLMVRKCLLQGMGVEPQRHS